MANILAIGAHPDDIELGCGATLASHVATGDHVTALIVSDGESGPGDVAERRQEARDGAAALGVERMVFGGLPDGAISNHQLELVHLIERVCREAGVDRIYTHGPKDSHQDHRAVALATMGGCRQVAQVLCYDSPSSLGFTPTVFVDISDTLSKKLKALNCHRSQVQSSLMVSHELVTTQAGYRGFQARTIAAEGFEPVRLVLDL